MSNCMNTWFQISMKRSPSSSGLPGGRRQCARRGRRRFPSRGRRAGVGHHPEVVALVLAALVVADADDALGRQADDVLPDVIGLVVFVIDRGQQLLGGQAEDLGQQLPAPLDGLFLK
jgi:hypothetical protein